MSTVDADARLAADMLSARRAMGVTRADLARMADLPIATVERAEHGEGLRDDAARSLLPLLGMSVLREGPRAVAPVDADHARTMACVRHVADPSHAVVFPDVGAIALPQPVDPEEIERAWLATTRLFSTPKGFVQHGLVRVAGVAFGLAALGLVACGSSLIMTLLLWLGGDDLTRVLESLGVGAAALALGSWTIWLATLPLTDDREERGERHRDLVLRNERHVAAVELRASRDTGFELDDDGIVVHRVTVAGMERRPLPAVGFRSVEVTEEDASHVTVRIDGVLGPLVMPWLLRDAALDAFVEGWRRTSVTGIIGVA